MAEPALLLVWCRHPRLYNKRSVVFGEVFLLPRWELPREFDPWCARLPADTRRLAQHRRTGRVFLTSQYLDWYLEAYNSWDETSRPAFGKALGKAEQARLRRALAAYAIRQYEDRPSYAHPLRPRTPAAAGTVEPAASALTRETAEGRGVPDATPSTPLSDDRTRDPDWVAKRKTILADFVQAARAIRRSPLRKARRKLSWAALSDHTRLARDRETLSQWGISYEITLQQIEDELHHDP